MKNKITNKITTPVLAILALILFGATTTIKAAPGDLDLSFGSGGKLTDWTGEARSVAIAPNGKIVVVGNTTYPPLWDVAVARYNSDGSPDVTFGNAGKVSHSISLFTYLFGVDVAVQQDGKIVITGYDNDKGLGGIIRLNENGSLDTSFDNDGVVLTYGGSYSVTIQPDGKIITTAGVPFNSEFSYQIRRFNANGSIDTTFGGGDGVTDLPIFASAVVTQADGKIVGAGESTKIYLRSPATILTGQATRVLAKAVW